MLVLKTALFSCLTFMLLGARGACASLPDEEADFAHCVQELEICARNLAQSGLFVMDVEIPPGATRLEQCRVVLTACESARKKEDVASDARKR